MPLRHALPARQRHMLNQRGPPVRRPPILRRWGHQVKLSAAALCRGAGVDGRRHSGPDGFRLRSGAGSGSGQSRPPHPALLPAAMPLLPPLLREMAAAPCAGGIPVGAGSQLPPALLSGFPDVPRHLAGSGFFKPVHPVPRDDTRRPDALDAAGGHVGSGSRLPRSAVRLFPRPQPMEASADGMGGTGYPAAGAGRNRPIPPFTARKAAPAVSRAKLLSDAGGADHLFPHVCHRPLRRGDPCLYDPLCPPAVQRLFPLSHRGRAVKKIRKRSARSRILIFCYR